MSIFFSAALKIAIIAGGGPVENGEVHRAHAQAILDLLKSHELLSETALFWSDGKDPAPDRILHEQPKTADWLLEDTALDELTAESRPFVDTKFEGVAVFPARRSAIQSWLTSQAAELKAGDQLLLAISSQGERDIQGNVRIALNGETWSVDDMAKDLAPISEDVRVLVMMSPCYSGAFATLSQTRRNFCGSFSTEPEPLNCAPLQATEGYFPQMLRALEHNNNLKDASNEILHLDPLSDLPHLTSDALIHEALISTAAARNIEFQTMIDSQLERSNPEASEWLAAARIAQDFGLGVIRDFAATREALDRIEFLNYVLDMWRNRWKTTLDQQKLQLIEPLVQKLPAHLNSAQARKKARKQSRETLQKLLAQDEALNKRMHRLYDKTQLAQKLKDNLVGKDAAAMRISYLYMRLASQTLLDPAVLSRLQTLQECEATPLWDAPESEFVEELSQQDPEFQGPPNPEIVKSRSQSQLKEVKTPTASDNASKADGKGSPTATPQTLPTNQQVKESETKPQKGKIKQQITLDQLQAQIETLHPSSFAISYRDLPDYQGVTILSVQPGGASMAAGLVPGDRVLKIGDYPLDHRGAFPETALLIEPGERVIFSVWREGQVVEIPLTASPVTLPPMPPRIGDKVPPLRLQSYDSNVNLPYIGAQFPTVLFVFATWCSACLEALPALQEWAESRNAKVIAVTREDRASVEQALKGRAQMFPFPVALDVEREVTRLLDCNQMPAFFYIDAMGRLVEVGHGYRGSIPLSADSPIKQPETPVPAPNYSPVINLDLPSQSSEP